MAITSRSTLPDVNRIGSDGCDAPSVLVELLATRWPDMRARLLAEHIHDGEGRCRGCRVPGYGTPGGHWPCLLATLATLAERRRAEITQQGMGEIDDSDR